MADLRIPDLTEYTGLIAYDDVFEMVDTSDTTDDASGSSFRVEAQRIGLVLPNSTPEVDGTVSPTILGAIVTAGALTLGLGTDRIHIAPLTVVRPVTITSATVIVTSGVGSSTIRIGIYSATADFVVNSLVADFGTVDSSTTGRKTIGSLSQVLPVGHYFTAVCSNSTPSVVTDRCTPITQCGSMQGPTVTGISQYISSLYRLETSAASALPSSFGDFPVVSAFASSCGLGNAVLLEWSAA
jgi:hypothetical protein